jgi:orotidine-5'-phosphate decarboxylase
MINSKVIVALDFDDIEAARCFVDKVSPDICRLKVGKQMFTAYGPAFVQELQSKGFDIFLDLKFHDIPNTVAKACVAAAKLGVWMCNIHASGGFKMMEAARQAVDALNLERPLLLIAVTVLTSMSDEDLIAQGSTRSLNEQVLHLAREAQRAGLDGVVCSAFEAEALKAQLGSDFLLVTPGIRLEGGDSHDQKRVMTPGNAVKAGSDYLVMGRSITAEENPQALLDTL